MAGRLLAGRVWRCVLALLLVGSADGGGGDELGERRTRLGEIQDFYSNTEHPSRKVTARTVVRRAHANTLLDSLAKRPRSPSPVSPPPTPKAPQAVPPSAGPSETDASFTVGQSDEEAMEFVARVHRSRWKDRMPRVGEVLKYKTLVSTRAPVMVLQERQNVIVHGMKRPADYTDCTSWTTVSCEADENDAARFSGRYAPRAHSSSWKACEEAGNRRGFHVRGGAVLHISQLQLSHGIAVSGAGAQAWLTGVIFDEVQHYAKYGGALAISDGALVDCRDCNFIACMGDYGGAVYVGGESTFNVGFTTFYGNTAWASGGAVAVLGDSKFECSSCEFDRNEAHGAGGALAVLGGTAELDDAKFTMNCAVTYGGAVFGDVPARIALTGPMNGEDWLRGNMIMPGSSRPELREHWLLEDRLGETIEDDEESAGTAWGVWGAAEKVEEESESWLDEPPGHLEFDKRAKYPEAVALWGRGRHIAGSGPFSQVAVGSWGNDQGLACSGNNCTATRTKMKYVRGK